MNHLFDILGGLEFRLQFLFQVGKGCEVDMWHHWQESSKCAIHYQTYKLIRQLCQSIQKCYDNWQRARFALIQAYQKHKRLSTRVILKMKNPQIGLLTLLVVPMGTLRYHTKNGAHSMHPRVAIGGPIFTSMAM